MSDLMYTPSGPATGSALSRRRRRGHRRGRKPRSSRALRALALLLILAGGLAVLDTVVTLLWQEPISALLASQRQEHLNADLRSVERAPPTQAERRTLASLSDEQHRIAFLARELRERAGNGGAVGRIQIPRIGASFVVVMGTDTEDLKSGPGIYPETGMPGVPGTTAIAGHRTTYLAPFRHIDDLPRGSVIKLEMPYARFTYTVVGQRVVAPTDVQAAVGDVGYTRLVLSACTPLFSAAKRLLVYARLTQTVPEGAARRLPGGAIAHPIEGALYPKPPPPRRLPTMLESLDPNRVAPLV